MTARSIRPAFRVWPEYDRRLREVVAGLTADQLAIQPSAERWPLWADTMDPGRLGEELVYTRSSGEVVRMPYALAVGHSFNHATHHRGQMTAAVTALGHPGPALDWTLLLQSQTGSNHERIQHPRTSA